VRVVKGFFVIRERPFLFPVNCEMANFFLVKRDLVTEPWTANHRFFTRIAKWLFIFILKCDCKPWFSFSCKNSLVSVLKNKTTCGKETTRLNQNYVWTSADRAGRQVTLLIPPFLLVFLGIIAEGCLNGCKVKYTLIRKPWCRKKSLKSCCRAKCTKKPVII